MEEAGQLLGKRNMKKSLVELEYSSVVECMPLMCKVPGLIPSTTKTRKLH
jgi:hypothetical protein